MYTKKKKFLRLCTAKVCPFVMCLVVGIFIGMYAKQSVTIVAQTSAVPVVLKFPDFMTTKADSLKLDSIIWTDSLKSIRSSLIAEVGSFINQKSPSSKMSPANLVDVCLNEDFDITLAMSQAHVETNFGTGNKSNSAFGVSKSRFSHPDKSVRPYVKVMKKSYVRHQTVDQALNNGLKVEGSKCHKYSTSPDYASTVKRVRMTIKQQTQIFHLQSEYAQIKSKMKSKKLMF